MQAPFNYTLPPERIAQRPCHPVHSAKLLVVNRDSKRVSESRFSALGAFLKPDDLLVFNDSKVIPARLFGKRGQLDVELLLLNEQGEGQWEVIGRPLRKLKAEDLILFSDELVAKFVCRRDEQKAIVEFRFKGQWAPREAVLKAGHMPIPPYIRGGRSDSQDLLDYQTQFARAEGSVAAPTASLHFSSELITSLKQSGCKMSFLTLHVGLSSIKEIEPGKRPGSERFLVDSSVRQQIAETKSRGGRVIAVGTTVIRALESSFSGDIYDRPASTDLFITPGFKFNLVDAAITNFHMPKSTHLLLVEALLGDAALLSAAYSYALENEFRFLSYGDGMLIV